MFPTNTAIRAGSVGCNFGPFIPPHIEGEERLAEPLVGLDQQFYASVAAMEATRLTAEFRIPAVSQVSKVPCGGSEKMQARHAALARKHVQRHAITAYGCGVNPGQGVLHRKIIDKIAGLEVIGAVENKLCPFEQSFYIRWRQIGDMGFNHDFGIESSDFSGRGDGLGQRFSGIGFVEKGLPLQIAGLNVIAVNDPDCSHAGASKQGSEHGASGAAADNRNARCGQLALALGPDCRRKSTCREYLSSRSKGVISSTRTNHYDR